MSGFFDDPPARPRPAAVPTPPQRSRALLGTAAVLVAGFFAVSVFTGVWTERLWFGSLGYSSVFATVLGTRVLLFLVAGALMGLVVGGNLFLAYRFRPRFRPVSVQASLERYREVVTPLRRWLLVSTAGLVAVFAGASGASRWREFLLWRNRTPFGTFDPYFGKDVGFYVFELPWLRYLVGFAMTASVLGLLSALLVHYLFGGIRLQAPRDKFSGAAQAQVSVLLGLFVAFKAVDYWLDRYDLTTGEGGLFTGMSYTDQRAVLPSKNILTFLALICALLLFANVLRRTWMLPSVGLALLALSAVLLGVLWPGVVQSFQVDPSELDKEQPYIARNIEATRVAYGIDGTEVTQYDAKVSLSAQQLKADAQSIPGIRLLDPALVSATFEQLQQVRGYYTMPPVLDVDRYPVNGQLRDMVVAVRELDQSGLLESQRNWTNLRTVYTHGYGVVAAYGNQRDSQGRLVSNDGEPVWAERDIPPRGDLSAQSPGGYEPRIYYGENSPSYSIVGKPPGGRDVELNIPEQAGTGGAPQNTTYGGRTGVAIGALFNKLLYAVKFSDANIVLSSRVNSNSRILYDRDPRLRVQKVAPWLTVDNDPYPAVVNGRVVWILDGYTTSDRYPNSERRSLSDMTSDALNPRTTYATLPSDEINYMRNSVKAVVDAYDGTVKLYAWDQQDPILKAWSSAFPGLVQPKSAISPALLSHMRYPEDLFKVQRNVLAEYHVTRPQTFYSGSDRWKVPEDPTNKTQSQPPYRLSVRTPTGGTKPVFSLTSVYVPQNRQNLAAFISVDSEASNKDYGRIRILRLPGNTQVQGPSQIANTFAADESIQQALLPYRNNSKVLYGNLLTLPVGDGLLYVQPVYTLREIGEGAYPVLRYVLASFGKEAGYGTTLAGALDNVLGVSGGQGPVVPPTTPGTPGQPGQPGTSRGVRALLRQAEAKFVEAQAALQRGDLAAYARAQNQARDLVRQALRAANASASPSGSSSPSPSARSSSASRAGG